MLAAAMIATAESETLAPLKCRASECRGQVMVNMPKPILREKLIISGFTLVDANEYSLSFISPDGVEIELIFLDAGGGRTIVTLDTSGNGFTTSRLREVAAAWAQYLLAFGSVPR